jgi:hypothetical protein
MTEPNPPVAASRALPTAQYPLTEDGVLRVYSAGPVTVLGFAGMDTPAEFNAAQYRAAISDLLLTRLPDLTLRVQVFNPSPEVQEVLSITRLNRLIEIHHVDLSSG